MSLIRPEAPVLDNAITAALDKGFLVVPGIAGWVGKSDYQQSIESRLTETFDEFCARMDRKEAS